ncbi:MAG: hypothetical protein HC905_17605 [Bacteroidales bacterium]|nr:hypothetical protein [Bacteroidales bacterium]
MKQPEPNKLFLLFVSLFIFFTNASGKQVLIMDSTVVHEITVPQSIIEEYRADEDFQYSDIVIAPGFFDRILRWLSEIPGIQYLVGSTPIVIYIILGIAFIVLLFVLLGSKFQGIFIREGNGAGINITESEISEHIQLDKLLDESIKKRNYNLAVRYLYLILLRQLNQKKLIKLPTG